MSSLAYMRFFITALLTAFAGAQTVHVFYKPLDDLDQLVEEEIKQRMKTTNESNNV